MNQICRDIFKAIHEGRWLSIEYKNKDVNITRYWISIMKLNPVKRMMDVEGLHLGLYTFKNFTIFIDSILSARIIEGSYCEVNRELVDDIRMNPIMYKELFSHTVNLKILNYLEDCNRLDGVPYKTEYSLIKHLDCDCLTSEAYDLSSEQFNEIVKNFQYRAADDNAYKKIKQLGMNVLSIHMKEGLYVLAYKKLYLDVSRRILRAADEITICREFSIYGEKQSIRRFLDADEYYLLEDFEQNQEMIKDHIMQGNKKAYSVDDIPYLIAIGQNQLIDLRHEYSAIIDMYDNGNVTYPIKAFFGELIKQPDRRKEYPIALINKKVNLDQLLAINTAVKYPTAYIQGPPGTGKTNTIINTIITAFFNDKTVLFASYNNHPIDSVFEQLTALKYRNDTIPFPIIRLGNNEKVAEAAEYIRRLYERTKDIPIYDKTLEKNKGDRIERINKLTELLKKHEEIIDLKERKETIKKLLDSNIHLNFEVDLHGRQLQMVEKRMKEIGTVTDEEALNLLEDNQEELLKYLYFVSVRCIKRLLEPKNKEILDIVSLEEEDDRVKQLNHYLKEEDNLKKFLRIFPIVATTCISAHKLSEPKPLFDMVIIDEASQCNTAVSLVPVIRGNSLMLVGDPQQLNPVIMLDVKDNLILKRNYNVPNEYDYIENSIYKAYLASDAVSDEILLSYHYRCSRRIIEFNNKKYYNNMLNIKTKDTSQNPLVFMDITDNSTETKNTSPAEAEFVIQYAAANTDKKIGVITPFASQKECISGLLKRKGIENVSCGTVHAFQGDEKDVILFSLAITDQTHSSTYAWLKNNKELINVAASRAREQLILLSSSRNLNRLHNSDTEDDIFELVEYVKSKGVSKVTQKIAASRALGIKPFSTETEEAFLMNLNHALYNVLYNDRKCVIHKEVSISHVFKDNQQHNDLFYSGRFDFVVYERLMNRQEIPVLAIELDGREHVEDEIVRERDQKKQEICKQHGLELIRIENSYARRYNYVKDILINYFSKVNS